MNRTCTRDLKQVSWIFVTSNSKLINNNHFEQNDWNRKKQGKVSKVTVSSTFKVDSYWLIVIKCSFMRKDGHDWKVA